MSDFLGREYNFTETGPGAGEQALFKEVAMPGTEAPDFTLENLDGGTVTLSDLKGLPIVLEFGSIT